MTFPTLPPRKEVLTLPPRKEVLDPGTPFDVSLMAVSKHLTVMEEAGLVPREKVFEAWTRPEQMKRWACPEGITLESVESEARPGGTYRLAMRGEEGERHTAYGTYRVVEPPERLVYTWDWEEDDQAMGETVVTVEFLVADEGTEVVLVHRGFPAPETASGHEEGWGSCLDRLEALF